MRCLSVSKSVISRPGVLPFPRGRRLQPEQLWVPGHWGFLWWGQAAVGESPSPWKYQTLHLITAETDHYREPELWVWPGVRGGGTVKILPGVTGPVGKSGVSWCLSCISCWCYYMRWVGYPGCVNDAIIPQKLFSINREMKTCLKWKRKHMRWDHERVTHWM